MKIYLCMILLGLLLLWAGTAVAGGGKTYLPIIVISAPTSTPPPLPMTATPPPLPGATP